MVISKYDCSDIILYKNLFDKFVLAVADWRVKRPFIPLLRFLSKNGVKETSKVYKLLEFLSNKIVIKLPHPSKYRGKHYEFPIGDYKQLIKLLADMYSNGVEFNFSEVILDVLEIGIKYEKRQIKHEILRSTYANKINKKKGKQK